MWSTQSRGFGSNLAPKSPASNVDVARFATGRAIDIIVYCPAKTMQLKEAGMHVRWPGVRKVQPLSTFAARIPRLADLERSYRDLWKFYVFADTSDTALLGKVREIARGSLGTR